MYNPNTMNYKDKIKTWMSAQDWQLSDFALDEILTQVDIIEVIPLKAELYDTIRKYRQPVSWDELRKLFNEQAKASHVIGYLEQNGFTLYKP